MKKRVVIIMMLMLSLGLVGCGSKEQTAADVAVVNGVKISQAQLDQQYTLLKVDYENQMGALDLAKDQEIIKNLQNQAYEEIITKELVRQEADRQGLKISQAEIDSRLASFKQAQNSVENDGYQKFLAKLNLTEADLGREVEVMLLFQQLQAKVTGDTKVSEAEARQYYEANQQLFNNPGGMRIYHILVDTEQQADQIIAQIQQGADFAALAAQYSLDPGSKANGGDVGLVNKDTNFVPEFKQAALALQPGQLSTQPVQSQYGYHVIKAGERQAAGVAPFAEVKEQLMDQLASDQKDKAFDAYLQKMRNEAAIEDLRK